MRRKAILRRRREGANDQAVSFPVEDLDTNVGVQVGKGIHLAMTRGADADRYQEEERLPHDSTPWQTGAD